MKLFIHAVFTTILSDAMSFVTALKCSRCGSKYRLDDGKCLCDHKDLGRLDIYYDYKAMSKVLSKEELAKRTPGLSKYSELLPLKGPLHIVSLGEGNTPLLRANRLAKKLGLKRLYLKNETGNPTGSFKDRSMAVGVSRAVEIGAKVVATASSGNAAASLAAYSAKAGLKCYAFVLEIASFEKISQLLLYGAKAVRVRGLEEGEDPTVKMLQLALENYGWYPCPSFGPFNPYQVEGPKTMSYEIIEQLNWHVPDWVFVPVGSACLLTGIWKGFRDFLNLGLIEKMPRLVAVQSTGNAPFVRAFSEGKEPFEIESWEKPKTVASGLADPYPWDGDAGLMALKETNGMAEAVPDELILEGERILASYEGVFAEPSGAAGLAGLMSLTDQGFINPKDEVVVLVTGSGLKDPYAVKKMFEEPPTVKPTLKALRALVGH